MKPEGPRSEFRHRITLWGGGCDTQTILPLAGPVEVADHVRRQLRIFGREGDFVFRQVHNILANVPPENVVAMFDSIEPS